MERDNAYKWKQKKAGVAILISDKTDFRPQTNKRQRINYITIKGSIHQEAITILITYVPNIGAPKYIKYILTNLKREIHNNTIIVGDLNIPL